MKRLNINLRKLMSFDPRKRKPIKENSMVQGLYLAWILGGMTPGPLASEFSIIVLISQSNWINALDLED